MMPSAYTSVRVENTGRRFLRSSRSASGAIQNNPETNLAHVNEHAETRSEVIISLILFPINSYHVIDFLLSNRKYHPCPFIFPSGILQQYVDYQYVFIIKKEYICSNKYFSILRVYFSDCASVLHPFVICLCSAAFQLTLPVTFIPFGCYRCCICLHKAYVFSLKVDRVLTGVVGVFAESVLERLGVRLQPLGAEVRQLAHPAAVDDAVGALQVAMVTDRALVKVLQTLQAETHRPCYGFFVSEPSSCCEM